MKPKHALTFDEKLKDPCIKVCVNDVSDELCLGCGRRPDEIDYWADLGVSEKTDIINQADGRLAELTQQRRRRRTGRRNNSTESIS